MNGFYFGSPEKDLFGIYHEPPAENDRRFGILLCYPVGQEHIRAHRAFKQMAERLCLNGFHVMRFDYYGTGDAWGDETDTDIFRWHKDIKEAVDVLQEYGDLYDISVVGMRLGAALAMEVASNMDDIKNVLLWDPVINGKHYLSEIKKIHKKWISDLLLKPPLDVLSESEILGFYHSEKMINSIQLIDLHNLQSESIKTIHFLISNTDSKENRYMSFCQDQGISCTKKVVENAKVWKKGSDMDSVLSSGSAIQEVVNYFLGISK